MQSAVVALSNLQTVGGTVASGFVAPRAMRGPVALQLTGNFVVLSGTPATSQSAALEGELAISAAPSGWGACSINLSFNFNTDTAVATVTGTACGYTIVL